MDKRIIDEQRDIIKRLSDCLDRVIREYNENKEKMSCYKNELSELRRVLDSMTSNSNT